MHRGKRDRGPTAAGATGLDLSCGDQISAEQTRRPELVVASDADEVYHEAR